MKDIYMKKILLWTGIAAMVMAVAGSSSCGGGKEQPEQKPLTIKVDNDYFSLTEGDRVSVRAKVEPASDDLPAISWMTRNPSVATVSDGTITAVGEGETRIVASCRDASAEITVKVRKKEGTGPEPSGPEEEGTGPAVLFDCQPRAGLLLSELATNGVAEYREDGLLVNSAATLVRLNRFYALGTRLVRYRVRFSGNAVGLFQSSEKDFTLKVAAARKKMEILTSPVTSVDVPFLSSLKDFDIEIIHEYQKATVRILDAERTDSVEVTLVNDGAGGVGKGVVNSNPFTVGPGWDYYCFGIESGNSMLVKRITVEAPKRSVRLLIYGDSITQPETYYPTSLFSSAWTQLIIDRLGGDAISSGRGGCTINEVRNYIANELPFIKAKYVMVTIGTNGGNTEQNLTDLVSYIKRNGSIPILNNIPSNESGTQVDVNAVIERVRRNMDLNGVRFDLATSLAGDGKDVDRTMMFWENYPPEIFNGWQVWHHPNEKGSKAMFERALVDVPEVFESEE